MTNSIPFLLDELIQRVASLSDVSSLLKLIKDQGATQEFVIEYLNEARNSDINSKADDWILEILDIASGYCQERYKVW